MLAFHRDLVAALAGAAGVVPFPRARRRRARRSGCVYAFADAGTVLFYQGGFAVLDDNKLRPGLVTHARCLQVCSDRGWDRYDFLAGDARYKRELSTGERDLVWATVDRPGLRRASPRPPRRPSGARARCPAGRALASGISRDVC